MRELPPSPVSGPTLVYQHTRKAPAGFYCSQCGRLFATDDPAEAFQSFAQHQQKCARPHKTHRKARLAS